MSDTKEHYNLYENDPLPEGEESPPPYVHTMAIVRWIILGGLSIFALIMILSAFGLTPSIGSEKQPTQYHCPMHPTYISNQPGDCPICGMTLVLMNNDSNTIKPVTDSVQAYHDTIPMPKAKPGQYTCPMDPEIISDKPGKCPICGMNLVKAKEATPEETDHDMNNMEGMAMPEQKPAGEMSDMGSSPVPGMVPITIEPERLQLIGVKTTKVQMKSFDNALRLVGYITPDETKMATVHVRTNGWVSNLFVDQTGQKVKKNEILFSFYSQELYQAEQDYVTARASTLKGSFDTSLTNMKEQLINASQERLHLLGLSKEEITQLEKSSGVSADLAVRSPFAGYVLEKSMLPGQYITPDQTLFTIADLSTIWLIVEVYEQDIAQIKIGQAVTLQTSAFPKDQFEGKISFIYPALSEKTRTLRVRIEIPNPEMELRPGMYAEVQVSNGANQILAVPSEAVVNAGEIQYAFVVHEGKHFEPRLLKIGQTSDDWIEILSGLSDGEEVVTSANFLIDSESRLKAAVSGMGGAQAGEHAAHGK